MESVYCCPAEVQLTVWCKSLLFNGHGYTVFDDSDGRMVFRVDNYAHKWKKETVLMDCGGNVLLTIRRCRKILKYFTKSYIAYKGERCIQKIIGKEKPLFKVTKDLVNQSCNIAMAPQDGSHHHSGYKMCWSSNKNCLKIYHANANTIVAEVGRKNVASPRKVLGKDVLTLKVQPGMDQVVAMAMIMITDSMR